MLSSSTPLMLPWEEGLGGSGESPSALERAKAETRHTSEGSMPDVMKKMKQIRMKEENQGELT